MDHSEIDDDIARRDERETLEAHRLRKIELRSRSILKDDQVTLLTLEGQLKVCGCFIILLVALFGICASMYCLIYVSSVHILSS